MSLLVVQNLEKSFGADTLFTGVSFRMEWGKKLGLIGRNGAGKTTLLRILTGQHETDKGSVILTPGITAGYLKQEATVDSARTVLQEAEAAFSHVLEMEQRMREVEREMEHADEAYLTALMEEYTLLHERFDAMGGFDSLRDIPGVLTRLGFSTADMNKPCGKLSGGEKTRLALARLLLSGPDLLYLDEPTNHLDIEAIEWLEGFLRDFGGAVVLVSHDRYFLDRVVNCIADLEYGKLTFYNGNFTAFATQKEANRLRQQEVFDREQKEIARLTEFFEKWKNTPSKKNQAVSRMRWAERIKSNGTERPDAPGKNVRLGIKPTKISGTEVVIFDRLGKSYGQRSLFSNLTNLIRRGDRVGIVGPNGAGKSTLVKILLGRETPSEGMARLGSSISLGYFAQDTSDLDLEATVLDNMLDVADMTPTQARTHLGKFLFSGDDAFKKVNMLSGGEKNKLVLAQLTYMRPNLLVLDEPTNHLDMDSREALGKMMREYEGTLLLVSHDRYLLDQVTNRTLEVENGQARIYDLPYSQYREKRRMEILKGERSLQPEPAMAAASTSNPLVQELLQQRPEPVKTLPPALAGMNSHQLSKERKRAKELADTAERKVEVLEERLQKLEARLSSPAPSDDAVALSSEYGTLQAELGAAMSAWENAAAYFDSINAL